MTHLRRSGILLHPTSLPSRYGVGDLGPEAERFVDFLAGAQQGIWQVLPLGPTGYGDSPYQCFSAFAGNPLLVSLDRLADQGLLDRSLLEKAPHFPGQVDYGAVLDFKLPLLDKAADGFAAKAKGADKEAFEAFCRQHASWLDDYVLFAALKEAHDRRAWPSWDRPLARRDPAALAEFKKKEAGKLQARKFWQYAFFEQWAALRQRAHRHGIRIMGDIPIFVAHDSADVWAHRELFFLEEDGQPSVIAGVPPDYFSATGQCWGNPLYRWDVVARTGYAWWVERFRAIFELVDLVRLDHFRGFEAYWEVPGGETTAIKGHWVKGPGADLFKALKKKLGELPIVAENLGVITPEVERLRESLGFPGMAILQFAFGGDAQATNFRPHNYTRNLVVYTGTHDNDTAVSWWTTEGTANSTRTPEDVEKEREAARKYLATDGTHIHWTFIRTVLASVADTAIIPLQDLLGCGSEARMNLPGRAGGNWQWRYAPDALTEDVGGKLRDLTETYGRAAVGAPAAAKA